MVDPIYLSMASLEESQLLDNPKYRQYVNSVEKVLKSFESSSEWADLISALAKLNKVGISIISRCFLS